MRNFFTRRTAIAALVFVLAVSALAGYVAPSADALPSNEVWTSFFNNASHDVLIGEKFLLCSGHRGSWGSTSAYFVKEFFPCGW